MKQRHISYKSNKSLNNINSGKECKDRANRNNNSSRR